MPSSRLRFLGFICVTACTEDSASKQSLDSLDAVLEQSSDELVITLSEPKWVIPHSNLPAAATVYPSNNNVSIYQFAGRLFLGWRTAPTHFASADTQIHIISSEDDGQSWDFETSFVMGTDLREPLFYEFQGQLFFSFFEGGSDSVGFEPKSPWRSQRLENGVWSTAEQWGIEGEVPWEIVQHQGRLFYSSYWGPHYDLGQPGALDLRFQQSTDGLTWSPVTGDDPVVYHGGGSEAAFGFDAEERLWAVVRNEEGDSTGFGALLCWAEKEDYGRWECPAQSDPNRYDSPRMFRRGGELYMVARRDVGGPFDMGLDELDFAAQQLNYITSYSARPKRTALYRINTQQSQVEHLLDFPSAGDTAFPSVVKITEDRYMVANYSSPLDEPDISWLEGQVSDEGTGIYLIEILFSQ